MVKNRSIKKLLLVALMLASVFLLSGCFVKGIKPLPFEERYQYIHEVQKALELDTVGEVGPETYDDETSGGVFTKSYLKTTVRGTNTFSIVKERIIKLSQNECEESSSGLTMTCPIGQIVVAIGKYSPEEDTVYITLTDTYSGRNQQEG